MLCEVCSGGGICVLIRLLLLVLVVEARLNRLAYLVTLLPPQPDQNYRT